MGSHPTAHARRFAGLMTAIAASLLVSLPAYAQQTPLPGTSIPKFVEPLPVPSALDGASTSSASPLVVTMSEFQTRILPASFYGALTAPFNAGTYVWGYNGTYPGPTIVAVRGTPTHVKYVNGLARTDGQPLFLQRTIKVDQTLHWADPLETDHSTAPYEGPVPAVVHLHGGEVPSAFDGGPDAWWTPGFAQRGDGFVTDTYTYPNEQQATAMFYHDHALGMTRLNVYAGMAGFYLLVDPNGEPANLPGGATDRATDQYGNPYHAGIAIQDRMFDTRGQLYFPSAGINPEHPYWLPEFFGDVIVVNGKSWPYMSVEPRRYRFRIVNGSNARVYEMRLMDKVRNLPGPSLWQIGSDGGLFDAPVRLCDPLVQNPPLLVMASGERADIIVDFSGYAGRTLTLTNGAKAPYPKGAAVDPRTNGMIMQFRVGTTVSGGVDGSFNPAVDRNLRPAPIERIAKGPVTRALTLNESMGAAGPLAMFVNNTMWDMDPTEDLQVGSTEVWEIINLTADTHPIHLHLFQYQLLDRQAFSTKNYAKVYGMPMEGMGPPLPYAQRDKVTGFKLGGNPDVTPFLQGAARPPDANERGWKDTFRMNPGEVTRILVRVAPQDAGARAAAQQLTLGPGVNLYGFEPWTPMGETDAFGYPGGPGYVWHCHIVDHEDNEMMRQMFVTGPTAVTAARTARLAATPGPERSPVLFAPSPNPTNGRSLLRFELPRAMVVDLAVFDVSGRRIASLASGTFGAGPHALEWDATRSHEAGLYFLRLAAGAYVRTERIVLVR